MLGRMQLIRTSELAGRLRVLDEAGSTNDVLLALAADASEPDFSVVATLSQTGGRGRLGRVWVAPPGKTVAVSVLLRPRLADGSPLGLASFGWIPLIAGVAMTAAVDAVVGETAMGAQRTTLKWPNDVHIDGRKVSGILAELVPAGPALVIGAGLNLTIAEDELPVATATSLALAGVDDAGSETIVDAVLERYIAGLRRLLGALLAAGGDAEASGIRSLVAENCSTLGREVRVQLPGAADLLGVATGIDETGRLLVRGAQDGVVTAVAAGDVTHLRYE